MVRSAIRISLWAVFSLVLGVIWQASASAAEGPAMESLGLIREGLKVPTRIDVDGAGNIYVADARKGAVLKFDGGGRKVADFVTVRATGGGLAVSPDGSRIYVAEPRAVAVLDGGTGMILRRLGAGEGEFVNVYDLDLDEQGYVFVADAGARNVKVYSPGGDFEYSFGGAGEKFRGIAAMTVEGGEVYLAESSFSGEGLAPRIKVFDLAGTHLRSIDGIDDLGPKPLLNYSGIAFDGDGRTYVFDVLAARLSILDSEGSFLASYERSGFGEGELQGPKDAVYDPTTGRLLVACDDGRVLFLGVDAGIGSPAPDAGAGVPLLLSPVADGEVVTARPRLRFENAEGASSHHVRLWRTEEAVADYSGLPGGKGEGSVAVDVDLEENARYFWSVEAISGGGLSERTEPQSFYVNEYQEAPSIPSASAPVAGEALDGAGVLSWGASIDPDPSDNIGYRVEISAAPSFVDNLVEEEVEGTTVALGSFEGYGKLEAGVPYFWRVTAVDNHGLTSGFGTPGHFLYETTVLRVEANMPGARVYLAGNAAFAGRFIGEAPVEIRDFPAGPCSVVVERGGFEPYIAQVAPATGEEAVVYADLLPALVPAPLAAEQLEAAGEEILVTGKAAPVLVDYDNDGLVDLLVGDEAGFLTYYRGVDGGDDNPAFTAGISLDLPLIPSAAPVLADWDNDGRKDLIVGASDGTVTLYRNLGSEAAPAFGAGSYLKVGFVPILVGGDAVPAVVDLDGDGAKDLAVGAADGSLFFFRNIGGDADPRLMAAGKLVAFEKGVAPFFADWDGDGTREILAASGGSIHRLLRAEDGKFAVVERIETGVAAAHLFAYDADGEKGKDLLLGDIEGAVYFARSEGLQETAAFGEALLEKVALIGELALATTPELSPTAAEMAAYADAGDREGLASAASILAGRCAEGTEIAAETTELLALLR